MVAAIEVHDHDLTAAFRTLSTAVLTLETIDAVFVPMRLPCGSAVMPTLVTDPAHLERIDPLAPSFALNAAKVVGQLTRNRKAGIGKIAVLLRPCEIRAFVELVKLNQGQTENILIIGSDCLGAFTNHDYFAFAQAKGEDASRIFYQSMLSGQEAVLEGINLSGACRACESFLPTGADLAVRLWGVATERHILLEAQTDKGAALLEKLQLPTGQVPSEREGVVHALVDQRTDYRDAMFAATAAAIGTLEKLAAYLSHCVNCYNCRVACPVCYCRECVFTTDLFDHDPLQYLSWAQRRGAVKLPTDTLFYHLTRMAHMSTACVGCGQCSNACPNGIDLMPLFRLVAHRTQGVFDYKAGEDLAAKPPLTQFKEDEFQEVVGIGE
ncbi:MAG: formate dehydrogenase [Desulfatitalea sp. BRH_c12]|nr:MAG: formate dehydrogenase [Desulfatitalea sp. BRH_c12]